MKQIHEDAKEAILIKKKNKKTKKQKNKKQKQKKHGHVKRI